MLHKSRLGPCRLDSTMNYCNIKYNQKLAFPPCVTHPFKLSFSYCDCLQKAACSSCPLPQPTLKPSSRVPSFHPPLLASRTSPGPLMPSGGRFRNCLTQLFQRAASFEPATDSTCFYQDSFVCFSFFSSALFTQLDKNQFYLWHQSSRIILSTFDALKKLPSSLGDMPSQTFHNVD